MKKILVIKLGALGDFVMAQAAFAAIREHHRQDKLTLLTIPGLVSLARATGLFDEVIEDPRASWPRGYWRISQRLRHEQFAFVFDLQGTSRTGWYWRLLWPSRPAWAGPVVGCSHPRPSRPPGHRVDWYRAQLTALGIAVDENARLDWLQGDVRDFRLPDRYALLVAGGSAHRPDKRWSPRAYGIVAQKLLGEQITPVLIGTDVDRDSNRQIAMQASGCIDLTGRTSLGQIASLARGATVALGNDTGPMHIIAAAGAPSVVVFSQASDPHFIAPRGRLVRWLQKPSLTDLDPSTVLEVLTKCLRQTNT
jgi:ADP-heptose:LPS heptosyltransferase